MNTDNIVITIGRMMGSGGTILGKAIAKRYGFHYMDKEFLVKAARSFHTKLDGVKLVDEKTPNWAVWGIENVLYGASYITSSDYYVPTSATLFNIQTRIMKEAAEQGPCVMIGRCSPHLFRNHPKHLSIFLQADAEVRLKRVEREAGNLWISQQDGLKYLHKEDKERAKYYSSFTGRKWNDMEEYDFVLDTTPFTDEQIQDIVFHLIETRFPELKPQA